MPKFKLKILYFLLPIVLVMGCILFWQPLFSAIVEYSFKSYCRDCFKAEVVAQNVRRDYHTIIFDQAKLVDSEDDIHLNTSQLVLAYEPHLLQREVDLQITLVDPQVNLEKMAPALATILERLNSEWGFFKINHRLKIDNGVFDMPSFEGMQKVHFSVDHDSIDADKVKLHARFNGPESDSNAIVMQVDRPEKGTTVFFFECKELCCQSFSQALGFLCPNLKDWGVQDGILDGYFRIALGKNDFRSVQGDALLKQLTMSYDPLEIRAKVPEVHVHFYENQDSVGEVTLADDSTIVFEQEGTPFLEFKHLNGKIQFPLKDSASLAFDGVCSHHNQFFNVRLEGDTYNGADKQKFVRLNLLLDSPVRKDVSLRLLTQWMARECQTAVAELRNFGADEFDLVRIILRDYSPIASMIKMTKGSLDAILFAPIVHSKVQKLNLVSLQGKDLGFAYLPWDITAEADELNGKFDANLFADNILSSLKAQVSVAKGLLKKGNQAPLFSDIYTDLNFDEGYIKESIIKGKFLGLDGEMHLDWYSPEKVLSMEFAGNAERLLGLFPETYRGVIEKRFRQDTIVLEAKAKREGDLKTVDGAINFFISDPQNAESIRFGFDFVNAADLLRVNWANKELNVAEFAIRNGWFEAPNIRIEKYLSPFIYPDEDFTLSGSADIKGTFNDKAAEMTYAASGLNLESEDLSMEAKSVKEGRHHFDFTKAEHTGTVPLENATYFEKNSGLLFTDINGIFELKDKLIQTPHVETFCNGVFFSGAILLDCTPPEKGVFSVDIQADTMKGKFSQVQHLFSHFKKPFFFVKMPMEGNVSFRKNGGHVRFDFFPGDFNLSAFIEGSLTDGTMASQDFDVNVQELGLDFEYDHQANYLNFSDIQGLLLVGKPDRVEEYSIAGDHVRFTNYSKNEAEFDLWVGDKKRDIIRVVGKTLQPNLEADGEFVEFVFNNDLTHFGDVHANALKLIMKDWSEFETFGLQFGFKLNTLLHDLQRFSRTGFFFLSRGLLKELNDLKTARGNFLVDLAYSRDSSHLNYHITGEDVAIDDHNLDTFLLTGQKTGHLWSIEQLQMGDFNIAADILRNDDICKINFLGVRYANSVLLGMEGDYSLEKHTVDGRINLLEADLGQLKNISALKPYVQDLAPSGKMRATGEVKIELGQGLGFKVDSALATSFHDIEIKGVKLQNAEGVSCHFNTEKGVVLRKFKTAIKNEEDDALLAELDIEKAEFDSVNHAFFLENMRFKLPVEKLNQVADTLAGTFPDIMSGTLVDNLRKIKRSGNFEGALNIDLSPPHYALRLALNDDKYYFRDKEHDLKNFLLEFDPCEFKMSTQYTYQRLPFWVVVNSKSPNLDFGRVTFFDIHPDQASLSESLSPLVCYWHSYPDTGVALETAEGNFAGCYVKLHRDPEMALSASETHLLGEAKLNMNQAAALCPPELAQKISEWEIGDGYLLEGRWTLVANEESKDHDIYFQGVAKGEDFDFRGYKMHNFSAQVNYAPDKVEIDQLIWQDPCGVLQANEIKLLLREKNEWALVSPLITINDFRPSLLRQVGGAAPAGKPLTIKLLEVRDLCGIVGHEESFIGHGWLSFANPHKKNISNPLFAIPAEILARIGLDLTVLNPVVGTIFYEIRNGKVVLKKFKDIYSEGRHSKFNLAENPSQESWVDFDGNLNVQVRMKQYNLLFKIAELFTVSIQGNLKKPTYSLQKQQKQHDSDQPKDDFMEY